jgi:hypothetical protein
MSPRKPVLFSTMTSATAAAGRQRDSEWFVNPAEHLITSFDRWFRNKNVTSYDS